MLFMDYTFEYKRSKVTDSRQGYLRITKFEGAFSEEKAQTIQVSNVDLHIIRGPSFLITSLMNKDNQVSQISYFIKHQLSCDLTLFLPKILAILWDLLKIRSGALISYAVYRLCRKFPETFWKIADFLTHKLCEGNLSELQQIIFISNLFFYGFPITLEQFMTQIFPLYEKKLIDLIPKYAQILLHNDFFPKKNQKQFSETINVWMQEQQRCIQEGFENLKQEGISIQQNIINGLDDQQKQQAYIKSVEQYETKLYRFSNSAAFINFQFDPDKYRLKSIFQLKKQCKTFKLSFQYSEYQRILYLKSDSLEDLRPVKKSQMIRLSDNEAYILKLKLCSNIKQCIQLGGYFIQLMNIQPNREELIEIVINQCYDFNNISYILKVVSQIAHFEPSLKEYCCIKGRKICGHSSNMKMNIKYQKLLCEMCRFHLIDEQILLDYCDKILKYQNNEVMKETESILQILGTMIYYRSLETHSRINLLFQRMESIIKSKLVCFNIQNLFHLKGLLSYLRNHSNKITIAETEEIAEFEIKTNFTFILKKMQKLLKQNEIQKIINFICVGVDQRDYLHTYYYASLARDLNCKEIDQLIHERAIKIITQALQKNDAQRSVCWSRFLGELYNYQVINKKKIMADLNEIYQFFAPRGQVAFIKCICAALETSKTYLLQSERIKDKKQAICIVLSLKKFIITNLIEQILANQVAQIAQYFHPQLSCYTTVERIDFLINESKKKTNLYILLDHQQQGIIPQIYQSPHQTQTKRKFVQKEKVQPQKKWVQKVAYKQKEPVASQFERKAEVEPLSPSKQSIKTEETRQCVTTKKKQIKVMGRSLHDKKIKVMTCSYTQTISQQ